MKRLIAASLVLALGACSGGGALPNRSLSPARRASTTLTIHWSSSASAQSKRSAALQRRPLFVSPSAQSIGVQVSPAGSTDPSQFVTTTINKPATGTSSTITFDAPAGNDDFVFAVFDQPDLGGNDIGGAAFTQTVVAGVANTVNATLDGYVGSVALSSTSPFFTSQANPSDQTLTLTGEIPVPVTITLKDIDGNVIIPPGTAPVSHLSSSDASVKVTASSSAANTFTVQAVAANSGFKMSNGVQYAAPILLQVDVSSGADGAQQYSTSFTLQQEGLIYAASGSGSSAAVSLIDQTGKTYTLAGAFSGLSAPSAMVWDDADGALFVADSGLGKILAFDAGGNPWAGWSPPSVQGVTSITYSVSTGDVYATTAVASGGAANAVLAFDKHGNPVTLSGFSGLSAPVSIAYANPDLAIIDKPSGGTAQAYLYSPNGAIVPGTPYALPSGFVPNACLSEFLAATLSVSTNSWGCGILGTSSGAGSFVDFYVDYTGYDYYYPQFTGQGLTNPVGGVSNPLYNGQSLNNVVTGTQPIQWYAINAPGGIVAINGAQLQDTSVTFPAAPAGAPNYTALAITY